MYYVSALGIDEHAVMYIFLLLVSFWFVWERASSSVAVRFCDAVAPLGSICYRSVHDARSAMLAVLSAL